MALPTITQPEFEITLPVIGKKVKFRPFLVKEEKVLLVGKEGSANDQMNAMMQTLKNVVISPANFDPEDLTTVDVEYLFMHLRGKSINNIVELKYKDKEDDYNAIMVQAIADRFAEAFAEYLHHRVRTKHWGYAADETLSNEELIKETYKGIRPAPGYPACPDHLEKETIWDLLKVEEKIGVTLTESLAMWPAAAVSGYYFGNEEAKYFGLGKITDDQVRDFANRKNITLDKARKWLHTAIADN